GFMRRFDAGYASAKKQIEEGRIGTPLVFKSTSRDPFRPSLEYANPKSSGGMLLDMGIHDFDLARWFMGEVREVATIGATIAYTTQLQKFAQNVRQQRPAPITIEDGMEALRIGVAATRAHETRRSVVVSTIK